MLGSLSMLVILFDMVLSFALIVAGAADVFICSDIVDAVNVAASVGRTSTAAAAALLDK